ncbi:hypothetical protein GN156_02625 [bacterium LRH843]|nr:hypothetical protein [bacterium LRH843]
MNYISKSFIILFSEAIWIYYVIAMFSSVEMNRAVFVNATWWIVAGIAGYVFNVLLAGKVHYLLLASGNALLLGLFLFQNWNRVDLEGVWILGVILSIAVSFVYVRSASFVYREPTRRQMLHRFEGNVIFYTLLAIVFTSNRWGDELFHITFLSAAFLSLIGMVLTLQHYEKDEGDGTIEVQKVGQSGWFTAVISILLLCVSIVCSLLFLPSIRTALYSVGMGGLGVLKWLSNAALHFISWLISLFPQSEIEGLPPEMTPADPVINGEMIEEPLFSLPIEWIVAILGVIVIVIIFFVLTRFLKKWQPKETKRRHQALKVKGLWWESFRKKINLFFKQLRRRWRSMFPRYYDQVVYWYYHRVQKWAKKNGIRQLHSETSKEYVEKIIAFVSRQENTRDTQYDPNELTSLLRKINQDYQATYYGSKRETSIAEYQLLLKLLKKIQPNKKLTIKNFRLKKV